jgi:predicted helicase
VSTVDVERLRSIKTFPSLVKYLRDELDWPIESDDFDELTFDYEPEDLGLDAKTAVKIKEIKQLRPLISGQPWGIFFVNFEPKRLPVVVLRRILRSLVIKKRQSANKPQQAAWQLHDLLFISAYGESEHRDITLANFSDDSKAGDLPTLKVLGWDDEDTVRHLAYSHDVLKEKLHWPDNPADLAKWRNTWSQAFTLKHREAIATSREMAERMAELATAIRNRVNRVLAVESEKGPMRKLMTAFREALIHDLKEDDFADMYAQTITYGLLSARVSRPAGLVADNIRDMVPITNPFLRDLLSTFLTVGGRKGKIDFDEVGINDVVQALRDANMEAVIRDFDDKNPQEDPVIHFYELFLKEYDPKKRMQRGVFFTPRPVVSFIVRSVDELLRTEFGLADGLADTTAWGEMAKRHAGLKIPEGTKPEDPFVQILDPACGTGTFLVEVIDLIRRTVMLKWRKEGLVQLELPKLWNEYVADHLLPRLYGFELMMAPYAIAHMKLGLKLSDTGYSFQSPERARVYLTNSLEPPADDKQQREFQEWAPALAHEAQAVNTIKHNRRFTVVIGNPPYSNFGQLNRIPFILDLLAEYKRDLAERKINLDDDFIKFVRFGQWSIDRAGVGVFGYITNNIYLEAVTHRHMRRSLSESFSDLFVVDLHGDGRKHEKGIGGLPDENVFDIMQGVAISVFAKPPNSAAPTHLVNRKDLVGPRTNLVQGRETVPAVRKYEWLSENSVLRTDWTTVELRPPSYSFADKDLTFESEYMSAPSIADVFSIMWSGIQTKRDSLTVNWNSAEVWQTASRAARMKPQEMIREFDLPADGRDWKAQLAIRDLRDSGPDRKHIIDYEYRPFDTRALYYTGRTKGWIAYPRKEASDHLLNISNVALIIKRSRMINVNYFCHVCVVNSPVDINYLADQTYFMPLYSATAEDSLFDSKSTARRRGAARSHNISPNIVSQMANEFGIEFTMTGGNDPLKSFVPEDIFHYAYAVFHSPGYRSRYAEFLKIDFPRLPLTSSLELFRALAKLGGELVALHLMESRKLDRPITKYKGKSDDEVAKGYPKYGAETVRINPTKGFEGVPENVWNFHIGGYQVCEKWLKDRRGRVLSEEDIAHYQKIVVALKETIRLMAEIDRVIEAHGGWPGAFATATKDPQP